MSLLSTCVKKSLMFCQNMMEATFEHPRTFPPSFQSLRQTPMNTGKRGRDSETEDNSSSDGRPLKRPFLSIGGSESSHNSGNSSRQGSEDWVHAAGGLSIDSPLYTPNAIEHPNPFSGDRAEARGGDMGEDVEMLVEQEPSLTTRPSPAALQMSFHTQQVQSTSIYASPMDDKTPRRQNHTGRSQSTSLPEIDITPATPVASLPFGQQYFGQHFTVANHTAPLTLPPSQQPVLSDAMPMALSPPPTHADTIHGSKRRIAFGPRANCEKCRLRIPGHFVHYD